MAKGMAEYARSSKAKAVTIWVTEGNNASVRVAQKAGLCAGRQKAPTRKRGTDKTYTDYRYFLQFKEKFQKKLAEQEGGKGPTHFRIGFMKKRCAQEF